MRSYLGKRRDEDPKNGDNATNCDAHHSPDASGLFGGSTDVVEHDISFSVGARVSSGSFLASRWCALCNRG